MKRYLVVTHRYTDFSTCDLGEDITYDTAFIVPVADDAPLSHLGQIIYDYMEYNSCVTLDEIKDTEWDIFELGDKNIISIEIPAPVAKVVK